MTIIEFIKSQLSEDTQFAALSKDIHKSDDFPVDKSEEEIIYYLEFKTCFNGTNSTFKRFLKAYKIKKDIDVDQLDLDANFAVLRTENWRFYKENFPVDKAILYGEYSNFYKVYCIDSTKQKALLFDIKSAANLNEILMVDVNTIYIGNLTEQVTVNKAICLLETCNYSEENKPDEKRFNELIEFLKLNN